MTLDLRIASPCEESWASMKGNERSRHCLRCKLNVFNIAELTEQEVRELFVKTEGRLCGRIYKRADGTVLTKDCPTGLARLRRKALAGLAMAVTLVVSVVGYRLNAAAPSCETGEQQTWFAKVIQQRVSDARETLRQTRTFGPLINELFPVRPTFTMGKMVRLPPVSPAAKPELE
jgi:hypothetical protein